jgi:hypothetical protein
MNKIVGLAFLALVFGAQNCGAVEFTETKVRQMLDSVNTDALVIFDFYEHHCGTLPAAQVQMKKQIMAEIATRPLSATTVSEAIADVEQTYGEHGAPALCAAFNSAWSKQQ